MLLLEDGQSRRMVEDGPTSSVVLIEVLDEADVGVGVVEASVVPALLLLLLLDDDLEDSAPPTPPPTAAATTIIATMSTIQNVRLLSPHIVRGRAGSWAASWYEILFESSTCGCAGIGSGE